MLNNSKPRPKIFPYKADTCLKYVPQSNLQAFIDEIGITDGQLLQYLPPNVLKVHKEFERTKMAMIGTFWITDISFVLFCDRIKLIKRLFSNQWAMFFFKATFLVVPYLLHRRIQETALVIHIQNLYSMVGQNYRKYKQTGDILHFNPTMKIIDLTPFIPKDQEIGNQEINKKTILQQ